LFWVKVKELSRDYAGLSGKSRKQEFSLIFGKIVILKPRSKNVSGKRSLGGSSAADILGSNPGASPFQPILHRTPNKIH
jgi:hypothetical protein